MLTAADLDLRPNPGAAYPLHVRIGWRHLPGLLDDELERFADAARTEDPDAAQCLAGSQ